MRQWFGISADEMGRIRKPAGAWKTHYYPLINMLGTVEPVNAIGDGIECGSRRLTRKSCMDWLSRNYPDRTVPRSACIGCPYHSDAEWQRMRQEDQSSWNDAIEFDAAMRERDRVRQNKRGTVHAEPFLHRSLIPLSEVKFRTGDESGQIDIFGFANECAGMCGV